MARFSLGSGEQAVDHPSFHEDVVGTLLVDGREQIDDFSLQAAVGGFDESDVALPVAQNHGHQKAVVQFQLHRELPMLSLLQLDVVQVQLAAAQICPHSLQKAQPFVFLRRTQD